MTFAELGKPLTATVGIYVPGTSGEDEAPQAQRFWTDSILHSFGALFGGSTAVAVRGSWTGADGTTVDEPVILVYSYCTPERLEECQEDILGLAARMGKDLRQKSVAVVVNEALYLLDI